MSADNEIVIFKGSDGKFRGYNNFLSSEIEDSEVEKGTPSFTADTQAMACTMAQEEWTEYGYRFVEPVEEARPGVWIRVLRTVRSELPLSTLSVQPGIYRAKSNPQGALSVKTLEGRYLGVKPGEFEELPDDVVAVIEKLESDIQIMVEKAADESLDGYRELGQRAAAAENERDDLRGKLAEKDKHITYLMNRRSFERDIYSSASVLSNENNQKVLVFMRTLEAESKL